MHKWQEYFAYDESAPSCLVWKDNRYAGANGTVLVAHKGAPAGWFDKSSGYYKVRIEGKDFLTHKVIWEMFNGTVSCELKVDHIDGSKNNRIENIRVVTQTHNRRNSKKQKNNTSGTTGVYHVRGGKFLAGWYEDGKLFTKRFSTVELASEYREQKIKELNLKGYGYTERHGT